MAYGLLIRSNYRGAGSLRAVSINWDPRSRHLVAVASWRNVFLLRGVFSFFDGFESYSES